jgi:hypothetical protein
VLHHVVVEYPHVRRVRERKVEDVDADERDGREREHLPGDVVARPGRDRGGDHGRADPGGEAVREPILRVRQERRELGPCRRCRVCGAERGVAGGGGGGEGEHGGGRPGDERGVDAVEDVLIGELEHEVHGGCVSRVGVR